MEAHNWFGDIRFQPHAIVRPTSAEEIIAVVKDHVNYPSPVRAAGSNHSVTGCVVSEPGTAIDMRGMNRILHIGKDRVIAQAGAIYLDVAKELEKHGLQFYVHIELGNITVGAASCTHTKDASFPGEYGTVSSYAIGMKAVLPTGEILEVTEDQPELLQAMRSSYGLLGVIYEVTFRVKPLKAMAFHQETFTLDEFERQFQTLLARRESIMYYLFPFQDKVSVEFRKYVDDEKPVHSTSWKLRNYSWATLVPLLGKAIRLYVPGRKLKYALYETVATSSLLLLRVLRSKRSYPADQAIRYAPTAGFAAYIFSIQVFPHTNFFQTLRAYFAFCRDYYREHGYRCDMINVGYWIERDESSIFSYNHSGPVMTIDPVSTGGPGWSEFLDAFNVFCHEHGGYPLFNQSPRLTSEQVRKAYGGKIEVFQDFQRRYDPENRFVNRYFAEMFDLHTADAALATR